MNSNSIRRAHLSDKEKKVLQARVSKFDGENLFPHNDKDGQKTTGSSLKGLKLIRMATFSDTAALSECIL